MLCGGLVVVVLWLWSSWWWSGCIGLVVVGLAVLGMVMAFVVVVGRNSLVVGSPLIETKIQIQMFKRL